VSNTTTLDITTSSTDARDRVPEAAMLVLVWCSTEPRRVGEVLVPREDGEPSVFGRGAAESDEPRAVLLRQRPADNTATTPMDNPFLSRRHLAIRSEDGGVAVENFGKRPLLVDGAEADGDDPVVRPGETIEIQGQAIFLCTSRPRVFPPASHLPRDAWPDFGEVDEQGFVGESVAAWRLRDQCALVGSLSPHVLLLGESGSGKELAAQAIHARSARGGKKLVARNAATFPPGLVDAELFGNVANYPNPGMPERAGVIGEADGGTLFLDEIAEMPLDVQSHLLRVLDEAGEYARLGEARRRQADLRVIAATNRGIASLKHDLAARLGLRLAMPSLNDRREDVPLLARHLLRRRARKDAAIGARFFAGWDGAAGEPRLAPALVRALVGHRYTTNVRELDAMLLRAVVESRGSALELSESLAGEMAPARPRRPSATQGLGAEEIRAALAKHAGVREKAWRELGLPNRYVLKRLMKKHGIAGEGDD